MSEIRKTGPQICFWTQTHNFEKKKKKKSFDKQTIPKSSKHLTPKKKSLHESFHKNLGRKFKVSQHDEFLDDIVYNFTVPSSQKIKVESNRRKDP